MDRLLNNGRLGTDRTTWDAELAQWLFVTGWRTLVLIDWAICPPSVGGNLYSLRWLLNNGHTNK